MTAPQERLVVVDVELSFVQGKQRWSTKRMPGRHCERACTRFVEYVTPRRVLCRHLFLFDTIDVGDDKAVVVANGHYGHAFRYVNAALVAPEPPEATTNCTVVAPTGSSHHLDDAWVIF